MGGSCLRRVSREADPADRAVRAGWRADQQGLAFRRFELVEIVRNTIGELLSCPFCIAQWVATGYAVGLVFAPRATRLAGAAMTAVAASDWLQLAYAKLMKSVE